MSSSIPDEIPETATLPQMWRIAKYWKIEAQDFTQKYWSAMEELDAAKKRIKFLEAADRFKIWNEKTGEWEVRFSISSDGRPVQQ